MTVTTDIVVVEFVRAARPKPLLEKARDAGYGTIAARIESLTPSKLDTTAMCSQKDSTSNPS